MGDARDGQPADVPPATEADGPPEELPPSTDGAIRPAGRQVGLSARVNLWSTALTALTAVVALILSLYTALELRSRSEASAIMPNVIRAHSGNFKDAGAPYIRFAINIAFTVDRKSDVPTLITGAWLELASPQIDARAPISGPWVGMYEMQQGGEVIGTPRYVGDADPIQVSAQSEFNRVMVFQMVFPDGSTPRLTPGRWNLKVVIYPFHQEAIVVNACLQAGEYAASTLNHGLLDGQASPLVGFYQYGSPMIDAADVTSCYRGN